MSLADAQKRLLFAVGLDHHVRFAAQPLRDVRDVLRVILWTSVPHSRASERIRSKFGRSVMSNCEFHGTSVELQR